MVAAAATCMKPWWLSLLEEQRAKAFADFGGAAASVTVPVSDRLLAAVVARGLSGSVRDLEIRAKAGNLLFVTVRARSPAWLPTINAQLRIERQPDLPASPTLVVRLLSHGTLAALAGPVARALTALPSWLRMDGELLSVDLGQLLQHYDAIEALSYLRRLEITTQEGFVVLAIEALVPRP